MDKPLTVGELLDFFGKIPHGTIIEAFKVIDSSWHQCILERNGVSHDLQENGKEEIWTDNDTCIWVDPDWEAKSDS